MDAATTGSGRSTGAGAARRTPWWRRWPATRSGGSSRAPTSAVVQTLEPLAARLSLPVEHDPALAEGESAEAALGLIERLGPGPVVLCTHGDVMEALVGEGAPKKKGATWLLTRDGGAIRQVRYWPPLA